MEKVTIQISLDNDVVIKLAEWADETGQSVGDVISFLVNEYEHLAENEKSTDAE